MSPLDPAPRHTRRRRPPAPSTTRIARAWGEKEACFVCGFEMVERAHIVPFALDGPNAPENFVLLCPIHHELAPDTGSPEAFEKWLARAKKDPLRSAQGEIELNEALALWQEDDPESAPRTMHAFGFLWAYLESKHGTEECSRFLSEEIRRAEKQLGGVTSHGSRLSSGTRVLLMKHVLQALCDRAEQELAQDADQDLPPGPDRD